MTAAAREALVARLRRGCVTRRDVLAAADLLEALGYRSEPMSETPKAPTAREALRALADGWARTAGEADADPRHPFHDYRPTHVLRSASHTLLEILTRAQPTVPTEEAREFHGWQVEHGVTCVVCPACAFTMDSTHTDPDGEGYTCPNCAAQQERSDER